MQSQSAANGEKIPPAPIGDARIINRAAARGLGVQLPPDFLKKADRIIG